MWKIGMKLEKAVILATLFTFSALCISIESLSEESADDEPAHVVFLVTEDPLNYEAHRTIPPYADRLERDHGLRTTVLLGEGEPAAFSFPDLDVLEEADLLVIFFRRRALSHEQLGMIRSYLDSGRPLVGIRTANHAFSMRQDPAEGYAQWWEFVPDVLGCENRGYGPTAPGTQVHVPKAAREHSILDGIEDTRWHSAAQLYHVAPLVDEEASVLLTGVVGNVDEPTEDQIEPVAWTRHAGQSRVFYTSLGDPADFDDARFRRLLLNGLRWALAKQCEESK